MTAYLPPIARYASDEKNHVRQNLAGLESFIFTYDGGKLKVWHDGPTLVYAEPTAKGGDPWNKVTLNITQRTEGYKLEKIGPWFYDRTAFGNRKHQAALTLLVECWKNNPTRDHLYQTIGKKSNHCAICGRELTVPESMARGIGPECITYIYGPAIQQIYIRELAKT